MWRSPKQNQKGGATDAEQEARIDKLELKLFNLKGLITNTVQVRQEQHTIKIASKCAAKASVVVEQLKSAETDKLWARCS